MLFAVTVATRSQLPQSVKNQFHGTNILMYIFTKLQSPDLYVVSYIGYMLLVPGIWARCSDDSGIWLGAVKDSK